MIIKNVTSKKGDISQIHYFPKKERSFSLKITGISQKKKSRIFFRGDFHFGHH